MTCSLKSQNENNKDETSPNISWGMDIYLHEQIVYAHKDLLSALLHNHSARRYKYLHVLIIYAHADSLSALQYNRIQHKVRLEKKTLHQNHIFKDQTLATDNIMKIKRKFENIRLGAILPDTIWLSNHMTCSLKYQIGNNKGNSETCQSICLYACLCHFLSRRTYKLQSNSLLYNSETCKSVCLYMCPRHCLSRPAVTQHSMRLEGNPLPENQV